MVFVHFIAMIASIFYSFILGSCLAHLSYAMVERDKEQIKLYRLGVVFSVPIIAVCIVLMLL